MAPRYPTQKQQTRRKAGFVLHLASYFILALWSIKGARTALPTLTTRATFAPVELQDQVGLLLRDDPIGNCISDCVFESGAQFIAQIVPLQTAGFD